jgi:hypothetical protein
MVTRLLMILLVPLVLLLSATAATASFSIDVDIEAPAGTVPPGESTDLTVTVTILASSDWVCPAAGSVDIQLSVEDESQEFGFTGDLSPRTLSFPFEAGVHGGATDRVGGEETATFTPRVQAGIDRGSHLAHDYTIVATFDGSAPGSCVTIPPNAEGEWPEASGDARVQVSTEREELDDEENGENGGNGDTQDGTEESPAPFVGLTLLVTLAIIALRRTR